MAAGQRDDLTACSECHVQDEPAVNLFDACILQPPVLLLPQGLWNGTVPGLLLTIPYTAVQFVALQQCKEAAAKLGWTGDACMAAAGLQLADGAGLGQAACVGRQSS